MPTIGEPYNPYEMFYGAFVPNWLLERTDVGHAAKLVYGRLQQLAGPEGTCCATQAELARDLGVHEKRIFEYLQELREHGLIDKHRAGNERGTRYRFLWNTWADAAPRRTAKPRAARSAAGDSAPANPTPPEARDSAVQAAGDPRKNEVQADGDPRNSGSQLAPDSRKSEGHDPRKSGTQAVADSRNTGSHDPRNSGSRTLSDPRKSGSQPLPEPRFSGSRPATAPEPRKSGSRAVPEPRSDSRKNEVHDPRFSGTTSYLESGSSERIEREGEGTQYPSAAHPEERFQPAPDFDPFRGWDDPLPEPVPPHTTGPAPAAGPPALARGESPRAETVFREHSAVIREAIGQASPLSDRRVVAAIDGWLSRGEAVTAEDLQAAAEDARKFQGRPRGTVSVECYLIGLDRAVNARLNSPPPPDPVQEAELRAAEEERAARLRAAEEARQAADEAQRRHREAQHALIRHVFNLPEGHPDWALVPPAVAAELRLERRHLESRGFLPQ